MKTVKNQNQASFKQWNTTTEKTDKLKTKVSNIESRVAKIEKK